MAPFQALSWRLSKALLDRGAMEEIPTTTPPLAPDSVDGIPFDASPTHLRRRPRRRDHAALAGIDAGPPEQEERVPGIDPSSAQTGAVRFEDVEGAAERLEGGIERTPVMRSSGLDALTGASLFFKCENFQTTGAFKYRGALNAVMSLTPEQAAAGVATHSSGNHAAALTRAAASRGLRATVVMPSNASAAKMAAVRAYGGDIVVCEPTQEAREAALAEVVERRGCEAVPPFDDPRVIAGQGTCALELLDAVPDLDAVLAPVGGGGLLSGTVLSVTARSSAAVYGAEPARADDTARSYEAGRRIPLDGPPDTLADGLRTSVGELTFPIIAGGASGILTATEDGIVEAMRLIWQRMKILVEPSAALPLACVLGSGERFRGQRLGLVLSGGNLDLDRLPWCCLNERCTRA